MAVPAIELRPRKAVALFDAAIRFTSRSAGSWAIALPGGAAVAGALMYFADALAHRRPVLIPSLVLTAAWFFRGICQGAACAYMEKTLVGTEPTARAAFALAFRKFPSLVITVAYLAICNALTLAVTLGLSVFFISSHLAGYAVAMQGKEHPLSLYQTCSKMLGAARASAPCLPLFSFFAKSPSRPPRRRRARPADSAS